jgi:hypothetical protein
VITLEQYFQAKPHAPEQAAAALDLLDRRNALREQFYAATGGIRDVCPNTGSEVSGSKGGAGDGGFRLQTSTTGRALSSHKEARGVDDYDPLDRFDRWLDMFEDGKGGNAKLEEHGLYREHPDDTPGWCHLTTRAPGFNHRTFHP